MRRLTLYPQYDDWEGHHGGCAAVAVSAPRARVHYAHDHDFEYDFEIAEDATMDRFPYTSEQPREKPLVPFEGVTRRYAFNALLAYAEARQSALDLAPGHGLLGLGCVTHCDSGDAEERGGSEIHPNADRRRPAIWDDQRTIAVHAPFAVSYTHLTLPTKRIV